MNQINMKIIAISNQKGGVGKTTSSMNLASGFVLKGFKVLVIDLDPQGNLTKRFGIQNPEFTIHGILLREYPINPIKLKKIYP